MHDSASPYYAAVAKLGTIKIRELAKSIIAANPGGIRYSALVDQIHQQHPETPKNTIHGSVWNLHSLFPAEISKPSRGLFTPFDKPQNEPVIIGKTEQVAVNGVKVKEEDFYHTFAEWLKNDLDEATVVSALGGAGLKAKWGTPDVVGVYKPLASDLIKFPKEIISCEIKIDLNNR